MAPRVLPRMIVVCLGLRHRSCQGYLTLALLTQVFSMGMSLREHLAILPDQFERRLRLILEVSGAGYDCLFIEEPVRRAAH